MQHGSSKFQIVTESFIFFYTFKKELESNHK